MRARGPYEVKSRQLRALVLLLVLLPLLPTVFVIRLLLENIGSEQLEVRERAKARYEQFLVNASAALATRAQRSLPDGDRLDPASPWGAIGDPPATDADAILLILPDGRLAPPPAPPPGDEPAAALAQDVLDNGVRYAALPPSGPVRWRFFCETPEPLFALHPRPRAAASKEKTILLVRRRQRLIEGIGAFFQRTLDPQTTLRLVDENGESIPLVGLDDAAVGTGAKPLLAETALPPPLPAWRAQLFSVDSALVEGVARGQIAFYWWSVGGMFLITAVIAVAGGWALTRRLALHELSNDTLAVISHEMKTPLASTRMFIETLLDRRYRGGEAQADDYLRLIAEENARLERLVTSFQNASRLGTGRRLRRAWQARREIVRPEEIAAAACARLRARLEAPGCDFCREIEPDIPPLLAERETLVAALVNLLDNAWKYAGEPKRITLGVRRSDGPGRAWALFEVSDNGAGIEPEEQKRIFERFYQADTRLTRTHEGVGLGLSIVRSAVRAHGGTVSVQSAPGQGSTFTLKLPLQKARKFLKNPVSSFRRPEISRLLPTIPPTMETVLIIEDDAALSRGLKDNFSFQGYHVLLAADGERGLALAVDQRPDLIVLDLMLPRMNGYEICRRLRRERIETPVLVLTAKGEESDVVLGLELGADDYVKKPFSVRELLARAEVLLRRRRVGEPDRWTFGGYVLDMAARTLTREEKPVDVSPKELALLHFFLQRAGQALSREEILNRVWGYDVTVTPRSIDRFVATLRRKIEADPHKPEFILTAREFGYKFALPRAEG